MVNLHEVNPIKWRSMNFLQSLQGRFFSFFIFAIILSTIYPFFLGSNWGLYILTILGLITGIRLLSSNATTFTIAKILGIITIILTTSMLFFTDLWLVQLGQIMSCFLFYLFTFACLIWQISHSRTVTSDTIFGAISGYFLIAIVWSMLFQLIELLEPNSFVLFNGQEVTPALFIYFSHITIASVGYGEITPATPFARSCTALLGMIGQLYLTVVVAILIGIYLSQSQHNE